MPETDTTLHGRPARLRRGPIRRRVAWLFLALHGLLDSQRQRSALKDVLRQPHLARDIGREPEAQESTRAQIERLRQKTLW